jgi:hypothetical protein
MIKGAKTYIHCVNGYDRDDKKLNLLSLPVYRQTKIFLVGDGQDCGGLISDECSALSAMAFQ